MPLAQVVSTLLLFALAAGAVVAAISLALRLSGPHEPAPEPGLGPARIASAVVVLAWAVAASRMGPDGPRAVAGALGMLAGGLLGGLLALGPERLAGVGRSPRPQADEPEGASGARTARLSGFGDRLNAFGNFGLVVAILAGSVLAMSDVTLRQWAVVGLAVGTAVPALAAGVFRLEGRALVGAMLAAHAAVLAGALIWGERLHAAHGVGAAEALAFGGAAAVLGAVGAIAAPAGRLAAPVSAGLLTALAAYPLLGLALREPGMALAGAIGAGMAAGLAGLAALAAPESGESPPLLAMFLLVLGGATLLLANRLFGVVGVGLCGIGLVALAAGDRGQVRWLAVLLPAVFGGRMLLGLFLDRTYLRAGGVDVTQVYAFGALVLGFVGATALVRFGESLAPGPWAGGIAALLLVASPVLVGYFIHLLPLAAFLAGVIAAGFAVAALSDGLDRGSERLAPYLVVACGGAAAAAPFLTAVINAPRQQRIVVFILVGSVAVWYAVWALRSQLRPSAA